MDYFDYNATAPLCPAAEEAWLKASREHWHNPSAPYSASARARNLLEEQREKLAALLGDGLDPRRIVFTSGATESNNAVFNHYMRGDSHARFLVSAIEHPSIHEMVVACPANFTELPMTADDMVCARGLADALGRGGASLVSVMAANNETGLVQPVAEAGRLCRAQGVPLHCDATQWLGKLPARELLRWDWLTGCAHKFGGPRGVGFLVFPAGQEHLKIQFGGEQEHAHRGGTEDYPGVAGMVAALEYREGLLDALVQEQLRNRDQFEQAVKARVPGVQIIGEGAPRLWNTVMFIMPGHKNTRWVARLDKLGYVVSTGSACATGKEGPSHVLTAMGYTRYDAERAVRVSAGWMTGRASWLGLADAIARVWKGLESEQGDEGSGRSNVIRI